MIASVTLSVAVLSALAAAAAPGGCGGVGGTTSWAADCGANENVGGDVGGADGSSAGSSGGNCVLESPTAAFAPNFVSENEQGLHGWDVLSQAPRGYVYLATVCNGDTRNFAINLYKDGGTVTAAVTPQDLAEQAYNKLSPPGLSIGTAPEPSRKGYREGFAHMAEWFWVSRAAYRTISATASVPGLSATVTARPGNLVINTGDGEELICPAKYAETAYDPAKPWSDQQSHCTHTYEAPSPPGTPYSVSATITWTATWKETSGGADGGTLPSITTVTDFGLPVYPLDALYAGAGQ